jgi:hypothetical protein
MTPIKRKELRIKALEGKISWLKREREARE